MHVAQTGTGAHPCKTSGLQSFLENLLQELKMLLRTLKIMFSEGIQMQAHKNAWFKT